MARRRPSVYTPPSFAAGDTVRFRITGKKTVVGTVKAVRDDGKLVIEVTRDDATTEHVRAPLLCDPCDPDPETP